MGLFVPGKCLLSVRLKQAKMTQQELADRLGMTRSQVSDYATNRRVMSLRTAKNIATAVRCSIEELYDWERE